MSVIQIVPCILSNEWADFVEWMAQVFDLPVACRFDEQGWGRLLTQSPGITVIKADHFKHSHRSNQTVIELEVGNVQQALNRATARGANVVTPPAEVTPDGFHAALETPHGILLWLWENRASATASADSVHQGPIHFTVDQHLDAPPSRVFEAITKSEELSAFFVSKATGDLAPQATVTWTWDGVGDEELSVLEFRPNEHVAFHWKADKLPYHTRIQFNLSAQDSGTRLAITESGWDGDTNGLRSAFSHCEGWTQFLSKLQGYCAPKNP